MDFGFAEEARATLDARFAAREKGIAGSRRVIRASANAIRALHRSQWDRAEELMTEAGRTLAEITAELEDHPDALHAGFVADAAKEFAEARIASALLQGRPVPGLDEVGVDPIPFLHGLGEAVGELRRRLLDLLRAGEVEPAESLLEVMDGIVDLLAEMDYPDGMTNGLRRTTDTARALTERSRSDLTTTVIQERLRRELSGS